jgi:hypothetical protein
MNDLSKVIEILNQPFWEKLDFWIFFVLAIGSLIASIFAFIEAKSAKKAAQQAGITVKIQTIAIELSEIVLKLDKLDYKIDYFSARDFLNEQNRRVRRLLVAFKENNDYKLGIVNVFKAFDDAKYALEQVRPIDPKNTSIPSI